MVFQKSIFFNPVDMSYPVGFGSTNQLNRLSEGDEDNI